MRVLDNMKVSRKISASSGAILLLLLVASGIAVAGLLSAQSNFAEYRLLARQTNAITTTEGELLSARLGVQLFLRAPSDERAETVLRRTSRAKVAADNVTSLPMAPERKAEFARITGEIEKYASAFQQVRPLIGEVERLSDEIYKRGIALESSLTALNQSFQKQDNKGAIVEVANGQRNLLLARIYIDRFISSATAADADRAASELHSFQAALNKLDAVVTVGEDKVRLDELRKNLGEWRDLFAGIVKNVTATNVILDTQLDKIGPAVAGDLEKLENDNAERQNEIGPRASTDIERSVMVAIAASVLALITGVLSALLIGRSISTPIISMTAAMGRLAGGDKTVEIPAQGRKDEVGEMAEAVQVFKDNMIKAEMLAAEQEKERAAREERARRIETLTKNFDSAVAQVLSQVGAATSQMLTTATSMSATAEETNRQSTVVAAAAEQASSNVQTVASAAEELSSSIEEINRQVTQSTTIAGEARKDAERTNQQVEGLARSAQKIGEVVSLIQEIAEQTNLLALNATIEAARAGEAGKGFAVVASEVKNLASQTAKATEDISQQVGSIQAETTDAVSAIKGIGATIAQINEIATTIASAVEEQGAATAEISRNVQEAAKGTQEVTTNIISVTQAAGETGAAAGQVTASANNLASQSEELRKAVEEFLKGVRAA
ncbi:MAG: methyl-accepting chemotaxis protein [Oceanibaculum sp.]